MTDLALTVNGEARSVPGPATLADLLSHLGLDPRSVVVELNAKSSAGRAWERPTSRMAT
jgi:thiamine biosynthesis protein ThiS